ncbi:VWA domain-containing protein [Aurantimonas endophytica]|nr:VWA domain-containing protein [Aurantimonas endophytica]MCO6402350.1 VWA domain-containing protein [Aurantimonas endophytica]
MWSFAFPYAFLLVPLPFLALLLLPPRRAATGALIVPAAIAERLTAGSANRVKARARRLLPAMLWLALVVALAGPQRIEPVAALPTSGRDIVLSIDLSGSMEKEDFALDGAPVSRLDAVKRVASSFVRSRAGDRVGLVIFAETAYFAAPLTFDVESVARAIEEAVIGISGRSTAIADGLGLAMKRLERSDAASRVVILLSDGANNAGTVQPDDAGALARRLGIRVHTIALGPEDLETAPQSRDAVDTATLRSIASESGGETFRVRTSADLEAVTDAIDALETSAFDRPAAQIHRAYWVYPGSLALLLSLGLVLGGRRLA